MCAKFDILNHDDFLISGGCISAKITVFLLLLKTTEALKLEAKFGNSIISDKPQNQNHLITKLEALKKACQWLGKSCNPIGAQ